MIVHAGEPPRLTTDGRFKRNPVFTNNGRSIVYTVQSDSPRLVLRQLDFLSGKNIRLQPKATLPEQCTSFSRDGQRMAYLTITGNDKTDVSVFDTKGNETTLLKFSHNVPWDPHISPDGKWVVLSLEGQLVRNIVDENKEIQLTKSAGLNNWPNISLDGKRIAFSSSRQGDYDLYAVSVDGENVERLHESPGLDARPCWSPDATQIAFTSTRDGNYEIYILDLKTGDTQRVTSNPERDDFAAWHPTGKQLVVVSERNGQFDLYLHDVDLN